MHELDICKGLVDTIISEMERIEPPAKQLLSARVVVGQLRQIVPNYLSSAYKKMVKDTPIDGSKLNIVIAPIIGRCRDCKWHGEMPQASFNCKKCGMSNVDLQGGTELYLENLEVEQDDQP